MKTMKAFEAILLVGFIMFAAGFIFHLQTVFIVGIALLVVPSITVAAMELKDLYATDKVLAKNMTKAKV